MARRKRPRRLESVKGTPEEREASKEVEFSYAAEVDDLARTLIPLYHTHLTNARIEYVFRSKATKRNGKPVLGQAQLVSGLNAFLARATQGEKFFAVVVAADYWKGLTQQQQTALVDHELQHCWRDEDTGKLSLLPHDLEEFGEIVRRHGLWSNDLQHFSKAMKTASQLEFD